VVYVSVVVYNTRVLGLCVFRSRGVEKEEEEEEGRSDVTRECLSKTIPRVLKGVQQLWGTELAYGLCLCTYTSPPLLNQEILT